MHDFLGGLRHLDGEIREVAARLAAHRVDPPRLEAAAALLHRQYHQGPDTCDVCRETAAAVAAMVLPPES